VRQLVIDSLSYWTGAMGVDGFRFDEAAELGRDGSSGFSGTAPLLQSIASLASSDGFKIIAEPWDGNDGGEIGNFPPGWACWNGNYRDSIRLYVTGNITSYVNGAGDLGYAQAFYGDQAKMAAEGGPQKSVNMVVCHDGFNMTDLVSYGTPPSSLSWPFGPEQEGGPDNSSSWGGNQAMRRQAIRDFWTFQVLSRGLPMMLWGDEFGRTVNGNNNSYNIDSVATWNNYGMIGTASPDALPTGDATGGTMPYDNNLGTFAGPRNGNFAFLQSLLHLRGAHPAFRQGDFTSEAITFTNADGSAGFNEGLTATVAAYVSGSQVGDDDFLVLSNMAPSPVTFAVPAAPGGTRWVKVIDTNSSSEAVANAWTSTSGSIVSGTLPVGGQSIAVLEAVSPDVSPAFTAQPSSQTVSGDSTVVFHASAGGSPAAAYQWSFNGVPLADGGGVSGAGGATLVISGATSANAGSYTCAAANSSGTVTSAAASLMVVASANPGRLTNLSCRAQVGTGADIMTAGFVVGGAGVVGTQSVLVRGTGPTLSLFGLTGLLADPKLTLNNTSDNPGQVIATNAGWGGNPEISAEAGLLGAFPWGTSATPDSALLQALPPDNYTAQIAGAGGDTGLALVEVYDATPAGTYAPATPRMINLSALIQVGAGANVVFAGFVIGGDTARTMLIRASGPALAAAPFGFAGTLSDPQLTLTNTSVTPNRVVTINTGWAGDPTIVAGGASVGAFSWSPSSADSAILITLPPGNYTAGVAGARGDTGLALIELYEVP